MLPCKDAIEKLAYGVNGKLSEKQNFALTILLTLAVFLCSVLIKNIADCIVIIGATVNTMVGFNLPMAFYLKLLQEENGNKWTY